MAKRTQARAAVADGNGAFSIETIGIDPPEHGEVLLRLKSSGVCHTDLDSLAWGRPLVMGHEGAGVVVDVGPEVTTCRPGDRVMLNWAIPCGRCFQCERGKENICEDRGTVPDARFQRSMQQAPQREGQRRASARNTGAAGPGGFNASFSLGTMASHALVPEAAVLRLPDSVPFEIGAILGCAVMTGFGSAVNAAQVRAGSSVVVLGCGGVGLAAILGALHCGAASVIAVDVNPTRLAAAQQFGATHTILASRNDTSLLAAADQVREYTRGRGADYAFECTAVPALGPAPLAMVCSGGTAVGVSGVEQTIPVNMELFEWDKIYINPLYGCCRPNRDFPLLLRLVEEGRLPVDRLISSRYSLAQLGKAFEDMRHGRSTKGVLVLDS